MAMTASDWGSRRKGSGGSGSNSAKGRRSGYSSRAKGERRSSKDEGGIVDYSKMDLTLPF